ncbi:MAG: RNA polymerase sigma factor [Chitinophagaceae bacterium]
MKNTSDIMLIEEIRKGMVQAFDELYNRYWEKLYLTAYARLGNEEDAKDCVQELFYTIWEKRRDFTLQDNVSAYLFTALRNRIYNIYRYRQVHEKYIRFARDNQDEISIDTEQLMEQEELKAQIEKGIQTLPEKMQEIFRMSRGQGLSIEQVAQKLFLSPQTVKNQLSMALKRLRTKLGKPPVSKP